MTKFRQSQRVRLLSFEDQPTEEGIILGGGKNQWVVQLDEEFYNEEEDDGLREVTDDQLKIMSC